MLEYLALTFASLFAIVDPFAAIPVFLAVTAGASVAERRRVARVACVTATAVIAGFALAGPWVFRLFGITLAAFQIAGGLVLLLAALDMLRAQASPLRATAEEVAEGVGKDDVAITPLAIPLLAGPGAITMGIVQSGRAGGLVEQLVFYAVVGAVGLTAYAALRLAADGARRLSPTLLHIVTRLMGLLVAAIGVQFILSALGRG
jgi:multiple antibiotic resistance protein